MAPRMPTFLLFGASKSGTTACYFHLKEHPEIFMSQVKEPRFFAFDGRRPAYRGRDYAEWTASAIVDLGEYLRLFDGATTERALGEASVAYIYAPGAPERIREHIPDVRLVAILRDPAERAYSQFLHMRRDGVELERDFLAALEAEPDRARDDWAPQLRYAHRGLYHEHLSRYYAIFDREQIRVYLYDDFRRDTSEVMRDIYAFVGASPDFAPDTAGTYNLSGIPKSRLLFGSYQRVAKVARAGERLGLVPTRLLDSGVVARAATAFQRRMLDRPRMPEEGRARLRAFFRDDTLRLQDLIGRDLSHWLR